MLATHQNPPLYGELSREKFTKLARHYLNGDSMEPDDDAIGYFAVLSMSIAAGQGELLLDIERKRYKHRITHMSVERFIGAFHELGIPVEKAHKLEVNYIINN